MLKKFKKKLGLEIEVTSIEERYNEGVEFDETPAECYCPYCKVGIVTLVEFRNSCLTYTFAFLILVFLGWISFIILPFIWSILQVCTHLCPNCKNIISYNRRCSFPAISKELLTIRIGGCAIVLSKKYFYALIAICTIIFLFVFIRWLNILTTINDFNEGEEINDTWQDFLTSCGTKGQLRNFLKTEKLFNEIYYEKSINWEGVLIKIFEDFWGKTTLSVKMKPSQFTSDLYPDINLIANPVLNNKIAELDIGDVINFKATLIAIGRRTEPHLAYLWHIEKVIKLKLV